MSNLLSSASGIQSKITESIPSMDSLKSMGMEQISGLLGGAIPSGITDMLNQAADVISKEAGGLADTLTKTADSFLKEQELLTSNNKLSSIADEVKKGTKESLSKVQSLSEQDTGGSLEKAVAFKTKTVKDTVEGSSLSSALSNIGDSIPNSLSSQLSNIASRAGVDSITDMSGLDSAFKSLGSTFGNLMSSASSALGDIGDIGSLSNIIPYITENANSLLGSASGAIGDIADSVFGDGAIFEDIGDLATDVYEGAEDIFDSVTGGLSEVTDLLPDDLKNQLSSYTGGLFDNIGGEFSDYLQGSLDNIATKLPGLSDPSSSLSEILGYGNTLDYPKYNDGIISGTGSSTSTDVISQLYAMASDLCGASIPSLDDQRSDKDLYDLLLSLATKYGLTDLLEQLLKCDKYFDSRSESILASSGTTRSVSRGDPVSYNSILNVIGVGSVDASNDALYLNANMIIRPYEDSAAKVSAYEKLVGTLGVDVHDLIFGDTYEGGVQSYNSQNVALMAHSNTDVIDKFMDSKDRQLSALMLQEYT